MELRTAHECICDLWKYVKAYNRTAYSQEPDSFWDSLVHDGGELIGNYNNDPLCRKLVLAVIEYIRDEHRKETGAA